MPNKRHARKHHRDATRLASAGSLRTALTGFGRAAAAYRSYLEARGDDTARDELADLLAEQARVHTALGEHTRTAKALTERLEHLRQLEADRGRIAATELDLADAYLRSGRLLTATTCADGAVRAYDHREATDPAEPGFSELACALSRNARILCRAADPDLAVGAADQAARMLLAIPDLGSDPARPVHLRQALALAVELHAAAGRSSFAQGAARLLAEHFPSQEPPWPAADAARPLTLRSALASAGRLRAFSDPKLVDRLCPDPASHSAPPAVSARCDPGLAPVALHAVQGAVEALRASHPSIAWRMATEIHYLLTAADRQGERNLRLNFRDHGPVWMTMLLCLAESAARTPALAADLASVLAELLERLRLRHAADGHGPLASAAERFIDRYRSDR
ncbi:hypothetical protein [Glycomyces xiaoerkulensis]|uniref:hypothetical protein n=1 Tax=Glycomyces xiaoerkulensis TaxID=2038139 RepID=UPI000C25D5A1|nr:hypothetical protein [Glycomyces xiaoerkulensis]